MYIFNAKSKQASFIFWLQERKKLAVLAVQIEFVPDNWQEKNFLKLFTYWLLETYLENTEVIFFAH